MVAQLGLTVVHDDEPFEPESGAYGGHEHAHGARTHARAIRTPHEHAWPHGHRVTFGGVHRHTHDHDA